MKVSRKEAVEIELTAHDIGQLAATGDIDKENVEISIKPTERGKVLYEIERAFKNIDDTEEISENLSVELAE